MPQLVDQHSKYFAGQGTLILAALTNGVRGAFGHAGNVPTLGVSFKIEREEHKESQTGKGLTDRTLEKERSGEIEIDLEKFDIANLRRMLLGSVKQLAAGTVTDEVMRSGIAAGDIEVLLGINISSLVIKDSAASPATLVEGTHYRYSSHGSVEFLDVGSFVQPFKASYAKAASEGVTMMMGQPGQYFLRFEGLNRAEGNEPVLVEFYKVELDIIDKLDLITDKISAFKVKGKLLADLTKDPDGEFGYFGRIVTLKPAA